MLKIDSAQNDIFKMLLSLTTSKGLKTEGLFLLIGEKLIREFLKNPTLTIEYEIVLPNGAPLAVPDIGKTKVKQIQLASELFAELDILGTGFNLLVLKQPVIATLSTEDLVAYKPKGVEVVMPVGDPGNLGALLRSCEAFGVPRVILTREAAHPFLPKAVKASSGSVLRLPLLRGPSLQDMPRDAIALDLDGVPVRDFNWPENALLVVGEEGPGLGEAKFTRRIRIPTVGVESLNAVVAASIALAYKNDAAQKSLPNEMIF
jgi:TrmH family RNA methyltransferase